MFDEEKELLENNENNESSEDESKKEDLEDLLMEKDKPLDEDELSDAVEKGEEYEESENTPMNSIVEAETAYDYRALKYVNMYVVRVKRKSQITSIIMMVLALAAGAYIGFFVTKYFYFGIILGVLGLWMLYNILTEERRIDKQLKKYFQTHKPLKNKFLVNNEKIRVIASTETKTHTADYPWAYVQSIDIIPEYVFLFVNGSTPLVFDTRSVAFTKGTIEEFNKILKEQASLKPCKYYDKKFFKNTNFDIEYPVTLEEPKEKEEDKNE